MLEGQSHHVIRALIAAMKQVFSKIFAAQNSARAVLAIAPVDEVFRLPRMDDVRRIEDPFLR